MDHDTIQNIRGKDDMLNDWTVVALRDEASSIGMNISVKILQIQTLSARDGRFIEDVSSSSSFACWSLSFALGSSLPKFLCVHLPLFALPLHCMWITFIAILFFVAFVRTGINVSWEYAINGSLSQFSETIDGSNLVCASNSGSESRLLSNRRICSSFKLQITDQPLVYAPFDGSYGPLRVESWILIILLIYYT